MKKLYLYIHGKGGSFKEAEFYKNIVDGDVVGIDYDTKDYWTASDVIQKKYLELAPQYQEINIIANSIGSWFCMLGLKCQMIAKAYFISPIVDMEKLICDMMNWENITEQELKTKKEISTSFGEILSWEYLCFVRNNPIKWDFETHILYGKKDNLTNLSTIQEFANTHNASITIMENGEHWFHTQSQLDFLTNWFKQKSL